MAFQAISEVPPLLAKLGTSTSTLTTAGSNILSTITLMPLVFTGNKPPLEVKINGVSVKIDIPNINIPVTTPTIPPDIPVEVKTPELDVCHLDISYFGTLLKALMTALTTLIDSLISSLCEAIVKAIEQFMVLVESMKQIWEWLKGLLSNIWAEVKRVYNSIKTMWMDSNKSTSDTENIKAKLYKRVLNWMEEKMKILGDICKELKGAVNVFFAALYVVLEDIGTTIMVLPRAVAELPSDIACLLNTSTLSTKST